MSRRRLQRARAASLIAAGLLAPLAPSALAQAFRLGTWGGSASVSLDFARDDSRLGGVSTRTRTTLLEERLTLRNTEASVYDPRLLSLSLEGTAGSSQSWSKIGAESSSSGNFLWGYDTSAQILREKPYSLGLFANRTESVSARTLGGGSDNVIENRGASLFANGLFIPSTLSVRQELWSESPFTSGGIFHDERRNIASYLGQRGWTDGEMELRYLFTDSSDHVFPRLSYRRHEAGFDCGQDFGPDLNWHWDSRARGERQVGVVDLRRASLEEVLRVEPSGSLQTQARYRLEHVEAVGGATTTHTGELSLRHRLYESLTTQLLADAVVQRLEGGWIETFGGRADVAYTKRLPWKSRLAARLSGALHYEDQRLDSQSLFVPQESLTFATPLAVPIGLRNPFVVTSTITVTRVAAGPLPPGCLPPPTPPVPLVLGQDFSLRANGDVTEIVPIPCAGSLPGVNPGDTIAIDYEFTTSPSLAFTTADWRADLSVDFGWIRPFFTHEEFRQHLVSGEDGRFLDHQRTDVVGTELRHDGERFRGSVLVEARRFTSRRQSGYRSLMAGEMVSLSVTRALVLTASGEQTVQDFESPDRRIDTEAARLTLIYSPEASFSADAACSIRWYRDPPTPTEQTVEAIARIRWAFRQLELKPTLAFVDRRRGDSDLKEYRATVLLIRRF